MTERVNENELRYGPNGDAVAEFIERAKKLTVEEAEMLATARYLDWDTFNARHAAYKAAVDDDRAKLCENATWDATTYMGWHTDWNITTHGGDVVRNATWNAAMALSVMDLISKEDFDVLYATWREVIRRNSDETPPVVDDSDWVTNFDKRR